MNGSIYERELAGIFSGNPNVIQKFKKKLDPEEHKIVESLLSKPFFVTRSAGSLGADLIALRYDYSLIVEVKSSISETIMFAESSGQRQDQANRLRDLCLRAGLFVVYAYRLKNGSGDPWRLFTIPAEPNGRMRHLYDVLPKMGETKSGNYFLKWGEGFSLVRLLDYINMEI
ncbi:MAG: hypothetical protein M1476_05175 [Candidatus Thermoplasmatota archaeon]|nr:hypothetical protein [Candidatus Thermoplasmatota archaeon]